MQPHDIGQQMRKSRRPINKKPFLLETNVQMKESLNKTQSPPEFPFYNKLERRLKYPPLYLKNWILFKLLTTDSANVQKLPAPTPPNQSHA
jgi:hypothetical protein